MTTLNLSQQSARTLDIEKRKLEARLLPDIKRIFRNISTDASNLYKATGNIPTRELATNYNTDFIKEIRDIYRATIRKFGFEIRKDVEKKHGLFFDAEYKSSLLGLELKQSIQIVDDNVDEKLESINNQFAAESTFFIANQSEEQAEFIQDTNSKMLETALTVASIKYANDLQKIRLEGEDDTIFVKNKNSIIASNIKKDLDNKTEGRAKLITSQNIGNAESWSRQTEAKLVNDAQLVSVRQEVVKLKKKWITILDSVTRNSHALTDGQIKDIDEDFILGSGVPIQYPRQANAPIQEIIECRCIASYDV